MNARQKRLFEEARKKNPNLQMPAERPSPEGELTDEDLALIKQGVGDKSPRSASESGGQGPEEGGPVGEQNGVIVKYFEDKGFGFIRPETGGRDIFFHVSRLVDGFPTDLIPNARVSFELGLDKYGKTAATSLKILPPPAATT